MPREYIANLDSKLNYIDKDTFIQAWETRTKIVSCLVMVFLISAMKNPASLVLIDGILLGLLIHMGLGLGDILLRSLGLLPFLVFMSLPILLGGGLPIEASRIDIVLLLGFKALASLYIMFIMFFSQPMWQFFGALAYLKIPDIIMSIIFLSWRYVFVLGTKLKDMFKSLNSRNFQPAFNKITFTTMGQIVGAMLVKSLDTSDIVYNAMVSRGFDGKMPVSQPRKIRKKDLLIGLGAVGFIGGILIIERW